ncbi:MAG: hypothetical protein PSX81_09770 [bacterium]|nr:hypothetical protein [bacterium]
MPIKKTVFASLFLILFSKPFYAQTKLFFKTDIGLSSMRYRPAIPIGGRFGYGIGAEGLFKINTRDEMLKYWSFNPSLTFTKTAYTIYVANAANSNIVAKYLRLDMPLMHDFYTDNPSHELLIGAGLFTALPLGGHFTDQSTRYKMRYGNTSASNRGGSDIGMVFKLSMTHFANTDIRFSLQYNYGLTNLVPKYYNPNNIRIRSRNIYISFAFPIDL